MIKRQIPERDGDAGDPAGPADPRFGKSFLVTNDDFSCCLKSIKL